MVGLGDPKEVAAVPLLLWVGVQSRADSVTRWPRMQLATSQDWANFVHVPGGDGLAKGQRPVLRWLPKRLTR